MTSSSSLADIRGPGTVRRRTQQQPTFRLRLHYKATGRRWNRRHASPAERRGQLKTPTLAKYLRTIRCPPLFTTQLLWPCCNICLPPVTHAERLSTEFLRLETKTRESFALITRSIQGSNFMAGILLWITGIPQSLMAKTFW